MEKKKLTSLILAASSIYFAFGFKFGMKFKLKLLPPNSELIFSKTMLPLSVPSKSVMVIDVDAMR